MASDAWEYSHASASWAYGAHGLCVLPAVTAVWWQGAVHVVRHNRSKLTRCRSTIEHSTFRDIVYIYIRNIYIYTIYQCDVILTIKSMCRALAPESSDCVFTLHCDQEPRDWNSCKRLLGSKSCTMLCITRITGNTVWKHHHHHHHHLSLFKSAVPSLSLSLSYMNITARRRWQALPGLAWGSEWMQCTANLTWKHQRIWRLQCWFVCWWMTHTNLFCLWLCLYLHLCTFQSKLCTVTAAIQHTARAVARHILAKKVLEIANLELLASQKRKSPCPFQPHYYCTPPISATCHQRHQHVTAHHCNFNFFGRQESSVVRAFRWIWVFGAPCKGGVSGPHVKRGPWNSDFAKLSNNQRLA